MNTSMKGFLLAVSAAALGIIAQTALDNLAISAVTVLAIAGIGARLLTYGDESTSKIKECIQSINQNDLTYCIDENAAHGSMAYELGTLMKAMKKNLKDQVRIAKDVNEATDQLAIISSELSNAMSGISSSSEVVGHNTERQYEKIIEIQSKVQAIVEAIFGINAQMDETAAYTTQTMETIKSSISNGNQIRQRMELIMQLFRRVSDNILLLKSYSEEVGQLNGFVSAIAGQTSLLALNASIEAARAGEHGKGFAVVASEVSKLSSETNQVSGKIEDVIRTLQNDLGQVAASIENEGTVMEESFSAIVHMTEEFSGVEEALNQSVDRIQFMKKAVAQVVDHGSGIQESIHEIADFSGEITGQVQESVAQLSVQNRETGRLTSMTEQLAGSADKMLQNVANQAMEGHMLKAALTVRMMVQGQTINDALLERMLNVTRVDVIYVTDTEGTVRYCNEKGAIGLNFYKIDPDSFIHLRDRKPAFVATQIKKRVEDGQLFKFLGVMGDNQVIYQVGMSLKSLLDF